MRTANKLLLSFVALLVLLMLFSDIVLWANFKRGRSGDDDLHISERLAGIVLQPFKVLYLKGISHELQITTSDKATLILGGDTTGRFTYSQKNDTLFFDMHKEGGSTMLALPAIDAIYLSQGCGVTVSNFDIPQLDVHMGDNCTVDLNSMKVSKLNVDGGKESKLSMMGNGTDQGIGSFRLQLGKNSEFRSRDVAYQQTDIKLDSINVLEMTGRSLNVLKEIK
ncbi:hypothetical protein GO495_28825 [Chitinophaga oryziterrae]|uniref:Uncharacterized protein n=1 Tax=Chitinophaga oryziterrae TaxID=1031224 RepID=A0A6N8JJI7_9BACT|nr:hypothetical protein [Chitinophaga oryziterrae]MVT44631.1 hypothetical protein [Chitinophaga oryziterrae]